MNELTCGLHNFGMVPCIKSPGYSCLICSENESQLTRLKDDQERLTIKYEGYLQKLRDDWGADSDERKAFIGKLQAENARYREAAKDIPMLINDAITKLFPEECSLKTKAQTAMRCKDKGGTLAYFVDARMKLESALNAPATGEGGTK